MNRIFGKAKPKAPPPSLTDCIGTVRAWPHITRLGDSETPHPTYHPSSRLLLHPIPGPGPITHRPFSLHLRSCYSGHSWRHKPGTPDPSPSSLTGPRPLLMPTAAPIRSFLIPLNQLAVGPIHCFHFSSPILYPSFIPPPSLTLGPIAWYPRWTNQCPDPETQ